MNFYRVGVLVSAMAMGSALPATDPKDAAYVGATVHDGTAAAGRPDMVIVTRAGRIAAILPGLNYRAPTGTEVVNVRGKFVIPGLINSHVHLATSANPSAAKAYLVRELYSGVTAVKAISSQHVAATSKFVRSTELFVLRPIEDPALRRSSHADYYLVELSAKDSDGRYCLWDKPEEVGLRLKDTEVVVDNQGHLASTRS
jgi:hypothetical protein